MKQTIIAFPLVADADVVLYYGLHLHVLNNQQNSGQVKYMYMVGPPLGIYYKFITVSRIR